MKYFLIIGVVVVALIVAGYFLLPERNRSPVAQNPVTVANAAAVEGTVTSVDLEQITFDGPGLVTIESDVGEVHTIAVPSLGRNFCAAAGALTDPSEISVGDQVAVRGELDTESRIVPCAEASHYLRVSSTYAHEELGFSFTYEKGPDGYVLQDLASFSEHPNFVAGVVLTETEEYYAMQNVTKPREGPPTIQVRIIENTEMLQPGAWAVRNPLESNIERAFGEPEEAAVGGANAVHYVADGLYPIDTYVVAHGGYIYVLVGMYIEEDSQMHQDYQDIIKSFELIDNQV